MAKKHDEPTPKKDKKDALSELTADLQRIQAEFVNYKRRAEDERAEIMNLAKQSVIREFLAVRDSFDNEAKHRPAEVVGTDWAKSIDQVRQQFDQVLKSLGVEKFDSLGHEFNPHLHDAISMEDGDGTHEVVSEELQPGYKLGDQVLRHAMVKVGRGTPVQAPADPEEVIEAEKREPDEVQPPDGMRH